MAAFGKMIARKKSKTIVSWILLKLGYKIIFNRNGVDSNIETLDDALTEHCTKERRDRWVGLINRVVRPRFVRRFIEGRLNRGMSPHECVILSLDKDLTNDFVFEKEKPLRQRWANWYGNYFSEPLSFFIPGGGKYTDFSPSAKSCNEYDYQALEKVIQMVKEAEEAGRKIRAVGSGHALTEVAQCEDYIICTQHLNLTQRKAVDFIKEKYREGFEVSVNFGNQESKEKHYLFETSGGTKLRHLIQALSEHNLALINQGGSSIQSISGAIATSTHGSGIEIGPFPAFVRSMTLVSKGGKVFRVEPKNGITDPVAFESDEINKKYGITLIQDDQAFEAVQVGIGSMGVVFSLILEVQETYRLFEERILRNWEAVKTEMQKGDLYTYLNKHRHFEVLINPYTDEEAPDPEERKRKCLVTTRNYSQKTDLQRYSGKVRNYISTFISGIAVSGRLSPWVFNKNHESIPRMTNNSLKRLIDHGDQGGGYEDLSNNVLDQGLGELKFYGYAIEFGFEIERTFEAVDLIFKICEEAKAYNHFLAAPFALRFVKKNSAHLSMMHQGYTCMIELVSVKGVTGSLPLFMRLERELLKIGAVPHWGLSVQPWYREMVEKAFPRFGEWEIQQEKFGGKTFSNLFLERIKGSL